jgi:SSS family solute:Na+ symporter
MIQRVVPEMLGVSFGAIVVTIILIAVLAASMSTADSNLHALGAVLTRDVYDRFIRPEASEAEKTWFGRIVIIIGTLLAVVLVEWSEQSQGFNPLALIAQLMLLAIGFSAQLLPAAIDALYLHKGTRQGAAAGMIAGLGFVILLTYKPEFSFGLTKYAHLSALGVMANVVVFTIVSSLTERLPQEHTNRFKRILESKD